jgi:ferredoxin
MHFFPYQYTVFTKQECGVNTGNSDSDDARYQVVFELPEGDITINARRDEFILDAAREAGLILPSLCERGWCLTCAVKVLSGTIDQAASTRFYEADRQAGFALICTGQPRSNLRLRPGAIEEMRHHRDAHHLPAPRGTNATSPIIYTPPDSS